MGSSWKQAQNFFRLKYVAQRVLNMASNENMFVLKQTFCFNEKVFAMKQTRISF